MSRLTRVQLEPDPEAAARSLGSPPSAQSIEHQESEAAGLMMRRRSDLARVEPSPESVTDAEADVPAVRTRTLIVSSSGSDPC